MTPDTPTLPTSIVAELAMCVRDILADPSVASGAEVKFGRRHLAVSGAPRRVVFVEDRGKWTRSPEVFGGNKGYAGGEQMGCVAHIWGRPAARLPDPGGYSDDDADYHDTDDATELRRLVINAIQRAAPGIVEGDVITNANVPTDEDYGQAYTLRFILTTGVQRNAAIFALKNAPTDPTSPPDPQRPPGAPASTVDKSITTITS